MGEPFLELTRAETRLLFQIISQISHVHRRMLFGNHFRDSTWKRLGQKLERAHRRLQNTKTVTVKDITPNDRTKTQQLSD